MRLLGREDETRRRSSRRRRHPFALQYCVCQLCVLVIRGRALLQVRDVVESSTPHLVARSHSIVTCADKSSPIADGCSPVFAVWKPHSSESEGRGRDDAPRCSASDKREGERETHVLQSDSGSQCQAVQRRAYRDSCPVPSCVVRSRQRDLRSAETSIAGRPQFEQIVINSNCELHGLSKV